MSSVFGLSADPLAFPPYVAAKHGVVGLTRSAAMQYARENIRVNAVCPAVIETPITAESLRAASAAMLAWHPMGRFGLADEVARAVAWLCSDEASFITGAALPVDGGNSART
jgi:NAD(P)-dependent dehydrogenase (short-subunit alcohol dehydrogenase family)